MQPKYEHDCQQCRFLGRHESSDSDLYYHPPGPHWKYDTIIARYSSEGSDYSSGWSFNDGVPELAEAERLAKAAGYVK